MLTNHLPGGGKPVENAYLLFFWHGFPVNCCNKMKPVPSGKNTKIYGEKEHVLWLNQCKSAISMGHFQ
jgi:hypothetical protein